MRGKEEENVQSNKGDERNPDWKSNQNKTFDFSLSREISWPQSLEEVAAGMPEALISERAANMRHKMQLLPKSGLWKALSIYNQLKAVDRHQSPALELMTGKNSKLPDRHLNFLPRPNVGTKNGVFFLFGHWRLKWKEMTNIAPRMMFCLVMTLEDNLSLTINNNVDVVVLNFLRSSCNVNWLKPQMSCRRLFWEETGLNMKPHVVFAACLQCHEVSPLPLWGISNQSLFLKAVTCTHTVSYNWTRRWLRGRMWF